MTNLRRRIAAAERAMRQVCPEIISIILVNSLDGLDENNAESGGNRYRREPHESVEAFRARARAEAQRAGEKVILFGAQQGGVCPHC